MAGRPFLQLEIDEHSADAGAVTRIEAFLDSLRNAQESRPRETFAVRMPSGVTRRTVYLPPMTDHAHALAAAFRSCGVTSEMLPESDGETVRIGKQFSSGRECFPLALTTGDMVKATRRPDFDPDRSAFFMPTGRGPCRFGQYNRFHRMVLDDLGLTQVPIFAPMQEESVYREIGVVGKDFMSRLWQGVVAVDMLQKALWESRPYEQVAGQADAIYSRSLETVSRALERRSDPRPALREAYASFQAMERVPRDRPVIGIVGEIYIRANRFGNENIVRAIERLGGEARVAPVGEWLLYTNETARMGARMSRAWRDLLQAFIMRFVQERDERRLLASFNGNLQSLHEPSIAETLERARPYLHHSFEGEAVLSVGKAVDYILRGASGIVNVMPFACMPGTISGALLKRVCEDHGNIPLLTIAYEGQQDSQTVTRLEAFLHQARAHIPAGRKAGRGRR
jgi:predicted nucleotide-binding protein (sugar kinase/HSP70/actin superfamily)